MLVLSFLAAALCGCNTWKGVGNDIENLGSAISGDD
jgi:predicted small secreted protein